MVLIMMTKLLKVMVMIFSMYREVSTSSNSSTGSLLLTLSRLSHWRNVWSWRGSMVSIAWVYDNCVYGQCSALVYGECRVVTAWVHGECNGVVMVCMGLW